MNWYKHIPLSLSLAVVFSFVSGVPAQAQSGMRINKLAENLYLLDNTDATLEALTKFGGDVTVLVTDDGVLLVDCKFDKNHDEVVGKVKSVTDKPIKFLVLSHNHG